MQAPLQSATNSCGSCGPLEQHVCWWPGLDKSCPGRILQKLFALYLQKSAEKRAMHARALEGQSLHLGARLCWPRRRAGLIWIPTL